MTGGSTLRLAVLLLCALPTAVADEAPVGADVDPAGGAATLEADLAPPAFLPATNGPGGTPDRVTVEVAWSGAWDPGACDGPSLGVSGQLAGVPFEKAAPRAPRCQLAAARPPTVEGPAFEPIALGAPDAGSIAAPDATLAPGRGSAYATRGFARLDVMPWAGEIHAAASVGLATPFAQARARLAPPGGFTGPSEPERVAIERGEASRIGGEERFEREVARLSSSPSRGSSPVTSLPGAGVPVADAPPETRLDVATAGPTILAPPGPDAVLLGIAVASLLAVALALYQRVRRHAALDHPARRALHEACAALGRPASAGELGTVAGLARKTAEYHLLYLARLGLLRLDAAADGVRRFALPTVPPRVPEASLDERLMQLLALDGGPTARELASRLGVSRSSVERRLRELVLEGTVEARKNGARRYYLA